MELFCSACKGCSKKINEGAVLVEGENWHQECFVCAKCSKPLSKSFRRHDGAVYCEDDYKEYFADRCNGCGFAITTGSKLTAVGVKWHDECFVCCECKERISRKGAMCVIDGAVYCKEDKEKLETLSPEDREKLRSLPMKSFIAEERDRSYTDVGRSRAATHEFDNEERGACLSYGIKWMVEDSAASSPAKKKGAATLKSRATVKLCELPDSAYKERKTVDKMGGEETPHPQFGFEVFAPKIFEDLRCGAFGITEDAFIKSVSLRPLSGGLKGEGKSGQLFFFSWDQRLVVKTVESIEVPFFLTCLRDYHTHMMDASSQKCGMTCSLLPKFLGFYKMKLPGELATHVVVMANVFPPSQVLKETYDLKGVLGSKREVTREQRAKGTKVLKDRNFVDRDGGLLPIMPDVQERLREQINRDAKFLKTHNRMDYSLLLGIADIVGVKEKPDSGSAEEQWPTAEHHGVQSMVKDGGWGSEVFFMGIIDILQEFTFKKSVEGALKGAIHVATHLTKTSGYADVSNAFSARSAGEYGDRFDNFLCTKMMKDPDEPEERSPKGRSPKGLKSQKSTGATFGATL